MNDRRKYLLLQLQSNELTRTEALELKDILTKEKEASTSCHQLVLGFGLALVEVVLRRKS